MSRRIEIELTSARPDGTWTWRAAGARQPKGSLDGALVPPGVKAGEVLRAEADFEIEGITILSILPPKERHQRQPEHLELIARPAPEVAVTTQLVERSGRGGDRRRDRDDRPGPRSGGDSRATGDRASARRPARSGADSAAPGEQRGPRRDGAARDGRSATGGARPADRSGADRPRRTPVGGPERSDRPRQERPAGAEAGERANRQPRPSSGDTPRVRDGAEPAVRARARRLNPGSTHRAAALAALPPEQAPVAEQVLRGGIPAVRTALHLERERAAAEGRAAPNSDALLAMAESILPKLKAAEWLDRAEAAAKAPGDITLRDLRSVVTGADVARDEESRALAATLRAALEGRVTALRTEWTEEITRHLDEGRIVRALRLSGRPPEPSTRIPDELTTRLGDSAGAAMAPDAPADRWIALLEAVAASPVRRTVHPAGLPAEPGAELLRAAHQQSARIPALVAMLGISIPPPPPRRSGAPAPARSGGPRRPPAPPRSKPATAPPVEAGQAAPAPPAAEAAPVEIANVQAAPVETAPAETVSVEAAPLDAAPVEAAPVEPAPVEAAPADTAAAHNDPVTETVPAPEVPEAATPQEPATPVAAVPDEPEAAPEVPVAEQEQAHH